jgi:hypothetical protein
MPRPLEILLTVAASALGLAFFLSVPYWPREQIANPLPSFVASAARSIAQPQKAPLLGPSVLASARPAPALNLALPDTIATVVRRTGINGETGLIPTAASITTFRLRSTGDLVSVAAPTGVDPVIRGTSDPDSPFHVHGAYTVSRFDRGVTVLRWTESGVTYEVSSRTLDAARLAEIADKLR